MPFQYVSEYTSKSIQNINPAYVPQNGVDFEVTVDLPEKACFSSEFNSISAE